MGLNRLTHLDIASNALRSVEPDSLNNLYALDTIALNNNPWQCDCYLSYFKSWLSDTKSALGSESNIRCSSPEVFSDVTLHSIDVESLMCPTRENVREFISVSEKNSTELQFIWSPSQHTPDPSFIRRNVMYGRLKCQSCSDDMFQMAIDTIDNFKIIDIASSSGDNVTMTVGGLVPGFRYGVCVYDTMQKPDEVEADQCVTIRMSATAVDDQSDDNNTEDAKSVESVWPPIWFWALIGGLCVLLAATCGLTMLWKRKHFFKETKPTGNGLYDPPLERYHPESYIPGYTRTAVTMTSHPPPQYLYERNYPDNYEAPIPGYEAPSPVMNYNTTTRTVMSDRTYAECGSAGGHSRSDLRDISVMSGSREFDILLTPQHQHRDDRMLQLPLHESPTSRLVIHLMLFSTYLLR